jgi:DNA polymerase-3 subunit beta
MPITSDRDIADFPCVMPDRGEILGERYIKLDDLQFVAQAMSNEATRYYLCGIAFKGKDMVATNGHILNLVKSKKEIEHPDFPMGLIIPANSIKYVLEAAKEIKIKDKLLVEFYQNRAVFYLGSYTITTKYADGTFPDYKRVIPDGQHIGQVDQKDIKEALKLAKKLNAAHGLKGKFKVNNTVSIDESGKALWQHDKTCVSDGIGFEPFEETGYNILLLSKLCSGHVYFIDERSPLKIVGEGKLSVIMPVRL